MREFFICDFNSFFELLVAFTFAYSGLEGFREYFNKISSRDFDSQRIKNHIENLKTIRSRLVVFKGTNAFEHYQAKAASAENAIEDWEAIDRERLGIYDGTKFRVMFYLTGALYLYFIILCGFHTVLNTITEYFTIAFLSAIALLYHLITWFVLSKHAKNEKTRWGFIQKIGTQTFVKAFVMICISATVLSFIISPHIDKYQLLYFDLQNRPIADIIPSTRLEMVKVVIMSLVMSVSLVPYWLYYKRKNYFLDHYQRRSDETERNIETLSKDISSFLDLVTMPIRTNKRTLS